MIEAQVYLLKDKEELKVRASLIPEGENRYDISLKRPFELEWYHVVVPAVLLIGTIYLSRRFFIKQFRNMGKSIDEKITLKTQRLF